MRTRLMSAIVLMGMPNVHPGSYEVRHFLMDRVMDLVLAFRGRCQASDRGRAASDCWGGQQG